MKRGLIGWAIFLVSLATFAAPPAATTNVNVVNPVLSVEVANADPILTRNADQVGREIFRYFTQFDILQTDRDTLVATVPAGKRLVIENISWKANGSATVGSELVSASLRSGSQGARRAFLQINPPHKSFNPGGTTQDGAQYGPIYFDSGEEVWMATQKSESLGSVLFDIAINGHFETL